MRALRILSLPVVLAACDASVAPDACDVTVVHPVPTASEASNLGFSADDVLATLREASALILTSVDGDQERRVAFTFGDADTVRVEEAEVRTPEHDAGRCLVGRSLAFEVGVDAIAADGWVLASGTATVRAQGTRTDQIWVDASTTAEPGASLKAEADAALAPLPCEDVTVGLTVSPRPSRPWSGVPVGGVSARGCNAEVGLYDWSGFAE